MTNSTDTVDSPDKVKIKKAFCINIFEVLNGLVAEVSLINVLIK